jgi:hypothetical protein
MIKQISFPVSTIGLPPGSVAVATNFYAGLFGGPLSQLLKCLTTVKICVKFEKNGIAAVPVCVVRKEAHPGFSPGEINFIDRGSKLHCLKSSEWEKRTPETVIDGKEVERLFEEIENIFPYGDRDALTALKEAFSPDTDLVSSCALWIKYLMKDFGATIVKYDAFMPDCNSGDSERRCHTLPVAVFVADFTDIAECDKRQAEEGGLLQPPGRLCPNVTISNARSLKTLKRYELDYARLVDGKEHIMNYVRETLKSNVPNRLRKLRDETGDVLDELETGAFAASDERSDRTRKTRAARIIYQLEKIQRYSRAALADKEKAAENRIRRACDFLSPLGRRQQDVLGGAQIPLSYGLTGLRKLYERLDITTPDHQLIEMD